MLEVGVAVRDITPSAGSAMAGFAARSQPATGTHDPLSVRALVVGDTALVVADVIGLHEDMCAEIRAAACLDASQIVLVATHTHGGPVSMERRIGTGFDPAFARHLKAQCVAAIADAAATRRPATLSFGMGGDPGVAVNRRHAGGVTDKDVPVLRFDDLNAVPIALLTSYACHPVVLGPTNLQFTADYPGFVRKRLEAAHPGIVALFATGCCGDANTGHSAQASMILEGMSARTFVAAEAYADRIAEAALFATMRPASVDALPKARDRYVALALAKEIEAPATQAAKWRKERETAEPLRAQLLSHWIAWAEGPACTAPVDWMARVSVLSWGPVDIVTMPGEIFAETGLAIKSRAKRPTLTLAYGEGCPGYIAPQSEWISGGYEIAEAHRFYGMAGPFAAGAAERLIDASLD
jgi:neutral ceramidase